jgi:hypothetical protein
MVQHLTSVFGDYCNFGRPHMALRAGLEVRTPAMWVGFPLRNLTLRGVFTLGRDSCFSWRLSNYP